MSDSRFPGSVGPFGSNASNGSVGARVARYALAVLLISLAVVAAIAALRPAILSPVASAAGYILPEYITELPHNGFSATSNKCKICHALHGPDEGAFHLIRHRYKQVTFWGGCEQCHFKGSSFTVKYVYNMKSFLGEHTIGAQRIPDSTNSLPSLAFNPGLPVQASQEVRNAEGRNPDYYVAYDVLRCLHCHSPHNNNTMGGGKLLRSDPARDGGTAQTLTQFCSDCHNNNALAKKAHPLYGDGVVNVGGGAGGAVGNRRVAYNPLEGCPSCHQAKRVSEGGQFPHQGEGNKLLTDSYQVRPDVSSSRIGAPYRPLPQMDQICLSCHLSRDGKKGVGKDF